MIRAKPSRCTLTVGERRKRTWANPKKKRRVENLAPCPQHMRKKNVKTDK